MGETIYIVSIIVGAVAWIIGGVIAAKFFRKNRNLLTKSFLMLNFFFGVALLLSILYFYYPTASVEYAVSNYFSALFALLGVSSVFYAFTRIFYPRFKHPLMMVEVFLFVFISFKTYDLVDWVFTSMLYTDIVTLASNILVIVYFTVTLAEIVGAYFKTRIKFLKARLIMLAFSFLCLIIEVLVMSHPLLYEYRWLAAILLVWPFSILGAYAVTYRVKDFISLLGLEGSASGVLSGIDERITAFLWKYDSKKYTCEYYDSTLPSKCRLDPSSYKLYDCEGKKYRAGIICPALLRHIKERREG